MATQDRRNSMGLDETFRYWRSIEAGETPSLFKVANAIRTIDLALEPSFNEWDNSSLSVTMEAWSRIRDRFFVTLITRFNGYFFIYHEQESYALPAGSAWPVRGRIEFYPDAFKRRTDSYESDTTKISAAVLTIIRMQFANGEQTLQPEMFDCTKASADNGSEEIESLFERMYEICEKEVEKGKKRAQRTWYHTLCESRSCNSKELRRKLLRKLNYLETVWGCGTKEH